MWPTLEVGKDGQLSEESRMIHSLRSLKRFPGLSISLEPHPQSGDPEVKMELSSGTPIVPACQRPSLERIGRKSQMAEGLKCALSSSDLLKAHDFHMMTPGESKDQEDDHTCCVNDTVVMSKPSIMQELLQRPSIGINLALDQEDRRDMVRTRSFVIHDMKFGLEKLNKSSSTSIFHVDEPIRLPKEDSLVGLLRAREEELQSRCLRSVNNSTKVQEDNIGEYFISPRESREACRDLPSNLSGEMMERVPVKSAVEIGEKTIPYRPFDDVMEELKDHCEEIVKGVELVDTSGVVPISVLEMASGNAAAERGEPPAEIGDSMVDRQMGGGLEAGPVPDNMLPEGSKIGDGPYAGSPVLDSENKETLQFLHISSENLDMAKDADCVNAKDVRIVDTKIHEKDRILTHTHDNSALELEEDTRREEGQGITSGSKQMQMRIPEDRSEATDVMPTCASIEFHNGMTPSEASNEFDHDELPLKQLEATVMNPSPILLDSLDPEVLQSMELDNLLASYHSMETPHTTKFSYACIERANGLPGDPLTNLQCRICILETSQEVDILWNEIKRHTCLMALQVCVFAFVVLRSGILEVYATPPPT